MARRELLYITIYFLVYAAYLSFYQEGELLHWLSLVLLPSALLISIVGFVESVSVAQTLAAKRRERIDPNRELIGLGAANLAAGMSGGYPVTGGLARSMVNFDAGARTPMAGVLTAVGIGLTAAFLTPLFHALPKATLAATIIVAASTTNICTCWTSFVIRVISDGAPNLPTSRAE